MTLLAPFLTDFGVPLGVLLGAFGQLFDEPFLEAFSRGVRGVRAAPVAEQPEPGWGGGSLIGHPW